MTRSTRSTPRPAQRFPACTLLLLLAPACSGKDDSHAGAPPAQPPAKVVPKPVDVAITGVHLGLGRGEYDHVQVEQTVFAPKDKVAVSVYSDGAVKTATIGVRWLDAHGAVVGEETRPVTYNGSLATLFELAPAGGLAPGAYSVEVRLNDWLAETARFEVR